MSRERKPVLGRSTTVYIRIEYLDMMDKICEATDGAMNRSEIVNAALEQADLKVLLDRINSETV